jgi:hypothetical protein
MSKIITKETIVKECKVTKNNIKITYRIIESVKKIDDYVYRDFTIEAETVKNHKTLTQRIDHFCDNIGAAVEFVKHLQKEKVEPTDIFNEALRILALKLEISATV